MLKFLYVFFIIATLLISASGQINFPAVAETKKIDAEELKSLAKTPKNKRPVLINFWATWCGPCRVEFPDLVKIDAEYREKGLNFYIVSIDDFAAIDTRVPEFLQSYEAKMPSYLIDIAERKELARAIRRIAPRFPDSYPLTLLFDAGGRLVYQKVGVVNAKILRAEINKVLPKVK